jgi:hypothetical protein
LKGGKKEKERRREMTKEKKETVIFNLFIFVDKRRLLKENIIKTSFY